jgi:hypothetical protein
MTVHLYLSLIPEALIASMLPPEEFGTYYAVGSHKKLHGQAMFVELDPTFRHEFFKIDDGIERCVPHPNGRPKRSVYISTYRVLEHVPTSVMQKIYLVTAYGEVLGIDPSRTIPNETNTLKMYQEIAPVHPLVVSTLSPEQYYQFLTHNPDSLVHFRLFVLWTWSWVSWPKTLSAVTSAICPTPTFTIYGSVCWRCATNRFTPKL